MNQAVDISTNRIPSPALVLAPAPRSSAAGSGLAVESIGSGQLTRLQGFNPAAHDRSQVESFIADVYFNVHRARLHAFMPALFAIRGDAGQVEAAIGMRRVAAEPTFLEQYLDANIETMLTAISAEPVDRQRIAEVGNLASISAGASRVLIAFMVYHLQSVGVDWAVCTGTNAVRAALRRVGVGFEWIADARAECLGEEQANWGSYYRNNPHVLAVNIRQAAEALADRYRLHAGL